MGEAIDVAGTKDETAAQLEGIAAEFVLVMAGGAGAFSAFEIVAAGEMKQIGDAEVGDFVGLAILVDEQGKVDRGFLLEDAGVVGIAEADGGEGSAFFFERLLMFAQLRDVLAAEDSSIVAEENEHGGVILPQGTQTNLLAVGVREDDIREPPAESFRHDEASLKKEESGVKSGRLFARVLFVIV